MMEFEWNDILVRVFTFATGAGALGLMQFALSFRKQKKDEFVILRESLMAEFDRQKIQISDLQDEVTDLKKKLTDAISEREKYQAIMVQIGAQMNTLYEEVEALKLVDNTLPAPKWVKSKSLVMLDLNEAYERMFLLPNGKTKKDYIGKTDIQLWGEEIGSKYQENDRRAIEQRQLITTYEEALINENLYKLWVLKWPMFSGSDVVGVKGMSIVLPEDYINNEHDSKD